MKTKFFTKILKPASVLMAALFVAVLCPETAHSAQKSVTVNVSATILPLFQIEVGGPANGNIEFGVIQKDPDGDVTIQAKEVVITTQSNLRTPYIITQSLSTPLANENGVGVPAGALRVSAQNNKSGGSASQNVEVGTDSSVLFRSDNNGQGDTISANYTLRVPPVQEAGEYRSQLVYTLTTA